MQKSQPLVILIIITMAIILAIGFFLALTYIQRRPEAPTGTVVTNVEGVEVTIKMDPEKEIRVLSLGEFTTADTLEEQLPQEPAQETPAAQEQVPVPIEELPTATPEPTQIPIVPTAEPVTFEPYTVQSSDTLFSIATRLDTSIALMAQYGISQDDLVPGTVIDLPVGNPAYCPQVDRQPYAIGEADTAFSIGRKLNSSADELRQINNLDENYTVYAATIICVPRR